MQHEVSSLDTVVSQIQRLEKYRSSSRPDAREERALQRETARVIRNARTIFPATAIASYAGISLPELQAFTRDVPSEEAIEHLKEMHATSLEAFGEGANTAIDFNWSIRDIATAVDLPRRSVLYARSKTKARAEVRGMARRKQPPPMPGTVPIDDIQDH